MVDYFYLSVGEEHEIKVGGTLKVAFYFVGDVVFVVAGGEDFVDDVLGVVSDHDFGDVDDLVVSELEDEMVTDVLFEFGDVDFEVDSDVDDEAGGDCATVVVDADDLFDVGAGVDGDEESVGVFFVVEDAVLDVDVFGLVVLILLHLYY